MALHHQSSAPAPRRGWLRGLGLLLAAAVVTAPARAAEVDRFLPADTEMVFTLNVKQVLDSELVKKYGLEQARDALKNHDEVNDILKDLGFDPFKDLDRVIVALPAAEEADKGLVIAHGRYDLAKFEAKGKDAAKNHPDALKIHKVPDGLGGQHLVYEVTIPEKRDTPLFVALPDKSTLLASPGKDYVVDALKKVNLKDKPALKNKDFQALLERMDNRQSLSLAVVGTALTKGNQGNLPEEVRKFLEQVDAVGGGVTVAEDVKLEVVISAKTAQSAKDLNKTITDGLANGKAILNLLAAQQPELAPVVEIVNTLKSTAKDKTVTLKAQISAEVIEKALKKNQ
jgi:hypothetical protein